MKQVKKLESLKKEIFNENFNQRTISGGEGTSYIVKTNSPWGGVPDVKTDFSI